MVRIRVTPEQLRQISRSWDHASYRLEQIQQLIRKADRILDRGGFQSQYRGYIHHKISSSFSRSKDLAFRAHQLSRRLQDDAYRFEDADSQVFMSFQNPNNQSIWPGPGVWYTPLPDSDYSYLSLGSFPETQNQYFPETQEWVSVPNVTHQTNLTAENVADLEPHFGESLLELGEALLHGAFSVLEISANHVPVVIFFNSNGEPLFTSWLPDSMKQTLPYIGPPNSA